MEDTRCFAFSKSTGRRCKNSAKEDRFCGIHLKDFKITTLTREVSEHRKGLRIAEVIRESRRRRRELQERLRVEDAILDELVIVIEDSENEME